MCQDDVPERPQEYYWNKRKHRQGRCNFNTPHLGRYSGHVREVDHKHYCYMAPTCLQYSLLALHPRQHVRLNYIQDVWYMLYYSNYYSNGRRWLVMIAGSYRHLIGACLVISVVSTWGRDRTRYKSNQGTFTQKFFILIKLIKSNHQFTKYINLLSVNNNKLRILKRQELGRDIKLLLTILKFTLFSRIFFLS